MSLRRPRLALLTGSLVCFLAVGCLPGDPTPDCPPPDAEPTHLRIEGTRVLDDHDRAVTLRGVNFGGRSKFAPYTPIEFDLDSPDSMAAYLDPLHSSLDTLVAWGVVTLRVPWSWAALEPIEGTYDQAWLARLDALVDAAGARGFGVILDLHQDIYAEPFCGDGFPVWTLPGDSGPPRHDCPNWFLAYFSDDDVRAAFDRLWANEGGVRDALDGAWAFMVDRYADHPAVIGYEPLNEPGWGTMDRNEFTRDVLPAWYEDLVPRLASRDPDALFFLDTNGVDGAEVMTAMERPDLPAFVFAPHFYHPSLVFGDDAPPIQDEAIDSLAYWAELGAEWEVPILLGEFGIPNGRAGELPWIRSHYDAFDTLRMHSTHWEVSRAAEVWNGEDLSLMTQDGQPEPVVAEVARPWLRAVAGTVTDQTIDMDAGTATLAWQDPSASGVTEVIVPSYLWGAGSLAITGGCLASRDGSRVHVRATSPDVTVQVSRENAR